MPERRGFDLSVEIHIGDEGSKCTIARPGEKPLEADGDLTRGQLQELRRDLTRGLGQFRSTLGNQLDQGGNWKGLTEGLRILYDRGFCLFSHLFGGSNAPRIMEEFQNIVAAARSGHRFAVIDVHLSAPDCLPIEFLVLDPRFPDRIEGDHELEEVAAGFLGFSAVVRRELRPWNFGGGGGSSQTEELRLSRTNPNSH